MNISVDEGGQITISVCGVKNMPRKTLEALGRAAEVAVQTFGGKVAYAGHVEHRYVKGVMFLTPEEVEQMTERELDKYLDRIYPVYADRFQLQLEQYFLVAHAFVGADLQLQKLRGLL